MTDARHQSQSAQNNPEPDVRFTPSQVRLTPGNIYANAQQAGSDWVSLLRGVKVMAARSDDADLIGLKADDSRAGHIASGPLRPLGDLPVLQGAPQDFLLPHPQDDGAIEVAVSRPKTGKQGWTDSRLLLVPFTSIEASRYSVYLPWAKDGDKDRVRRALEEIDAQDQAHELRVPAVRNRPRVSGQE
ncbi:DUF4986 domain-containing protein [Bifidobacterium sp. ESL0827]|uniref:DUF4986 domain-containing protein n=1 Tax=Bifidobacterium sp. ESL0827 TaxID=3448583 RepID=UPI004043148A